MQNWDIPWSPPRYSLWTNRIHDKSFRVGMVFSPPFTLKALVARWALACTFESCTIPRTAELTRAKDGESSWYLTYYEDPPSLTSGQCFDPGYIVTQPRTISRQALAGLNRRLTVHDECRDKRLQRQLRKWILLSQLFMVRGVC